MFAWAECSWTNRPQHSWTDRPQHSWTDRLPRKDAICHAAPARCWVHPNRDPAFNPPAKAGKLHSAFCSEEEGIPTSNGLFHNAPLGRSPHSPTPFSDGAADRGEYRQAAGAENARAVMNSMQKESKPHRSEPHPNSDC